MMWMSIMGMYEYDPSLFDGLDVPSYEDKDHNMHVVDKNAVINSILLNCAELELLFTSFDMMKLAIGVWSTSEQDTWRKMYATQMAEYNPLWNVDADVKQTRILNRDRDGENQNINTVSGFNSESWSNADKDNGTYSDNEDITETYTERRTGNIGVTSSQSLLLSEREVAEFSIIEYITQSFKERFCLLVY